MYYPTMSSLIDKRKKGRLYTYWVRSARVNGQPRIVEQVYLGPKERVLEQIKTAYTRGKTPGPSPLRRLEHREFGASALLWHWSEQLGLAEIVDRHVPPVEAKRRTPLSVGQYLVIAALNRAIQGCSKRALFERWYQGSVLSRLWPASAGQLTSQRFWDHMDQVSAEHIEAIQHDLLARVQARFSLGEQTLLYDTTNYFSFIDSFNQRSELAQRGHNKQKRHDLRQVSLALFEDEATELPLYHQCYEGRRPDVSHFQEAWTGMVRAWTQGLGRQPQQLTLVFDRGNPSKQNLETLEGQMHYVGALPLGWVPDLMEVELERYEKLALAGSKQVKAYRYQRQLWGKERTLLLVFSPTLYRKQRASVNVQQGKVQERLQDLAAAIEAWHQSRRGSGYRRESVEQKIRRWTARDHLREFLVYELQEKGGKVARLSWHWDGPTKRQVQRRYLGKRLLFTDHSDWDSVRLVQLHRQLWKSEKLFRISKGRRGSWWPMFHWTDSKIRVHALYCYFALLLLSILQLLLRESELRVSSERLIESLSKIQETHVLYTNGAAERVLSGMDPLQQDLANVLGLRSLAQEMGTTLLD